MPGTPWKNPQDVYTTPGTHFVNGRWRQASCEPYSATKRCRTEIWATTSRYEGGRYIKTTGWVFNNLTYLPSPRSLWKGNPLGNTGSWTAADGRQWRTECDTATTGRNGCRSYLKADVLTERKVDGRTTFVWLRGQWVFNNIVLFNRS